MCVVFFGEKNNINRCQKLENWTLVVWKFVYFCCHFGRHLGFSHEILDLHNFRGFLHIYWPKITDDRLQDHTNRTIGSRVMAIKKPKNQGAITLQKMFFFEKIFFIFLFPEYKS